MNFKRLVGLSVSSMALSLVILSDASAAGVAVKCEVRNGRSKASVDGSGVRGTYYAKLKSGTATIKSRNHAADPVDREVEIDFDSNPKDVRAGAAAIPANFIKNRKVAGYLYRASDNALIGAVGATCQVK